MSEEALEDLRAVPPEERWGAIAPRDCRPLYTPKAAIDLAIARFHESWSAYRSITPTVYAIGESVPGTYVTLGRLRKRYGMRTETLDAVVEALTLFRRADGFLLATEAVGDEPPKALFGLSGHQHGEVLRGALDLSVLSPFEDEFQTELDVPAGEWRFLWLEARTNSGLA